MKLPPRVWHFRNPEQYQSSQGYKKDLEIVTAQLSMYSYMLGHLQGYMPQSAFVIALDIKVKTKIDENGNNVVTFATSSGTCIHLRWRQGVWKVLFYPRRQRDKIGSSINLFRCPPQCRMNNYRSTVIHHFKRNFQVAGQPGIPVVLADANAVVAISLKPKSL